MGRWAGAGSQARVDDGSVSALPYLLFPQPPSSTVRASCFRLLFTFIHLLAPPLSSIPKVRSVISGDLLQKQSASPHKQAELVSLVLAISLFFPATNRLVPICIYHIMPRLTTYQSKNVSFQRLRHTSDNLHVSPRSSGASSCSP